MKRTKEEIERERREAPLPRPFMIAIAAIEWMAEFAGELFEAVILGVRAGAWVAFVVVAFVLTFGGIVLALVFLAGAIGARFS